MTNKYMSSNITVPPLLTYGQALDEYMRAASLQQQLAGMRQQQQQQAQAFPVEQQQRTAAVQAQQQQNQIQQMQIQDQQTLRELAPTYVQKDDSGKVIGYDFEGLVRGAQSKGVSPQTLMALQQNHVKTLQDYAALDKTQRDKEAANNAWMFQAIEGLKGISDPNQRQQQYQSAVGEARNRGIDVSQFPAQAPSNDDLTAMEAPLGMHSQILADAKTAAETKKAAMGDIGMQELNAYLTNPRLDPGIKKDAATFAAWKAKQSPMGVILGNQLAAPPGSAKDEALNQAADRYAETGTLPSGFARSPGTMTAIMQRAAERHAGENIAGNSAVFSANKSALSQLQGQFSKVSAFEGTGLKNLDLYVQKAKAIPDLGVRFADVPLRMITGKMIGEQNYAAMNAARQVAASEVGRVLSSATGAGVLTNEQKKEVNDILDGNLPLAATLQVVETLRQDLANRHESYQQEINNLQQAVGGQVKTPIGAGFSVKAPNGKTYNFPTQQALDNFKKAAGIQ